VSDFNDRRFRAGGGLVAAAGPRGSRRRVLCAAPHHEDLSPHPEEHREAMRLEG